MMLKMVPIYFALFFLSCNTNRPEIVLERDILEIFQMMENNDTLYVFEDMALCGSIIFEQDIFTKENGNIYLETHSWGNMGYTWDTTFNRIEYTPNLNDTLNYESVFRKFDNMKNVETKYNNLILQIVYRKDTIQYFQDNFDLIGDFIHHIKVLKNNLYPKVEWYQPIQFPPPPPEPNFDEILNLNDK